MFDFRLNVIMTSIESEKINVILTRIVSPTEFWIKIQSNDDSHESCPHSDADIDKQRTHRDYLQRIKGTKCIF